VVGNALADAGVDDGTRQELLAGTTRDRATELVRGFSPEATAQLAAVSPTTYLNAIRAHVYLMHDTDDPFVPFTESRQMLAAAPADVIVRYTEFSIFEHVIPDRPVPWQAFLPDLWRLFWHVDSVLSELL
jgi:dipeptidyl aminopeptidase/acylaminoacyl peptidase